MSTLWRHKTDDLPEISVSHLAAELLQRPGDPLSQLLNAPVAPPLGFGHQSLPLGFLGAREDGNIHVGRVRRRCNAGPQQRFEIGADAEFRLPFRQDGGNALQLPPAQPSRSVTVSFSSSLSFLLAALLRPILYKCREKKNRFLVMRARRDRRGGILQKANTLRA